MRNYSNRNYQVCGLKTDVLDSEFKDNNYNAMVTILGGEVNYIVL